MINTATMLAHIKGSVRGFLFQFQDENRTEMVQYGGEISWGVSSTITKDSLLLRFIPMVRFFTPYRSGRVIIILVSNIYDISIPLLGSRNEHHSPGR